MGIESGSGGPAAEVAKQHEVKTERETVLAKCIQEIKNRQEGHPYLDPLSDDEIRIHAEREIDNPLFPRSGDVLSTGGLTPEAEMRFETVAKEIDLLQLVQALVDTENRRHVADEKVFRIATNAFYKRSGEFSDDLYTLADLVKEYINLIHAMEDRADDRLETYDRLRELVPDIEEELSKEGRIRVRMEEIKKSAGESLDEWEIREQAEDAVMKEIDEENYS